MAFEPSGSAAGTSPADRSRHATGPLAHMKEPPSKAPSALKLAREVLETEAAAIRELIGKLDEQFDRAVETLFACRGRVVVTGIGKSGIVARKLAATLSSTGTPSLFMHPAEALHGDLGMLVAGDVVVVLSYSGETGEVVKLLEPIKRLDVALVAMTGVPGSTLAVACDVHLDCAITKEACPLGLAPTASTTAMQ